MIRRVIVAAVFLLAAFATHVSAQTTQPTPGTDPHHPAPAQRPGGASPGGMGGMMGAGMMPAPGPANSPRMLQMRGEMLKAMGEILMKYGKMMEGARP